MTADEALQGVRDARQQMMEDWKDKPEEERLRELNAKAHRFMAEIAQQRQTETAAESTT